MVYNFYILIERFIIPTRPRIDLAGYHHIINRGVNRCDFFNHSNDKDMFLQIINKIASIDYLYTLIRYIENNPIEANITQKISEYPFTLSHTIFTNKKYYTCCKESIY